MPILSPFAARTAPFADQKKRRKQLALLAFFERVVCFAQLAQRTLIDYYNT